jgi:hypothetical protein
MDNRDNSGASFLPCYTCIYALINEKEALILYLSSTQFRTSITWDTSFVVKGVVIEPTNLTEQSTTVLSSMIVKTTLLTWNSLITSRTRTPIMSMESLIDT